MRRMRMLILILTTVLVSLAIAGPTFAWIGDRQLTEIEQRIKDTEKRLLQLDEDQLVNRLEWVNWGIDLLENDIREMEKEIQKKRERWEKLRNKKMSSEEAWREWERVGRELDILDRKKSRLYSTLEKLRSLRVRIEQRVKEIKGVYEPKLFSLGLGIGSLKLENRSTQVFELKLRTSWIDLFYGSDGYEEKTGERITTSYLGAEVSLGNFQYGSGLIRVPVGFEKLSTKEGITPCVGLIAEFRYQNAERRWTTAFGEIRWGVDDDPVITWLIGIFF